MTDCRVCRSISGEARISPGPAVFDGCYWSLEHAYPTRLPGWLVIVLKRHAEALHELSVEEFQELATIQAQAARVLHHELGCAKEYMACFAEMQGFAHLHIHVIPRAETLADNLKGARIFSLITVTEAEAIPPDEIRMLCEKLKYRFEQMKT
jgi:diadenosine tetraphosphate (Ap4A) HIT family hydrolase